MRVDPFSEHNKVDKCLLKSGMGGKRHETMYQLANKTIHNLMFAQMEKLLAHEWSEKAPTEIIQSTSTKGSQLCTISFAILFFFARNQFTLTFLGQLMQLNLFKQLS